MLCDDCRGMFTDKRVCRYRPSEPTIDVWGNIDDLIRPENSYVLQQSLVNFKRGRRSYYQICRALWDALFLKGGDYHRTKFQHTLPISSQIQNDSAGLELRFWTVNPAAPFKSMFLVPAVVKQSKARRTRSKVMSLLKTKEASTSTSLESCISFLKLLAYLNFTFKRVVVSS